jgi:hypothetical protein
VDARVSAAEDDLPEVRGGRGESTDLVEAERQQMRQPRSTGQTLRDALAEAQALRARQDEAPRRRVAIDLLLEIRQQLRHELDLVDDGSGAVLGEEPARIGAREVPLVEWLEGDAAQVRERIHAERRLAGLPRSGHGDDRILPRQFDQVGLEIAGDHEPQDSPGLHFLKVSL